MATPAPRLELHGFAGGGSAAKALVASADRIVRMMVRCIAHSLSSQASRDGKQSSSREAARSAATRSAGVSPAGPEASRLRVYENVRNLASWRCSYLLDVSSRACS